ncbi:PE-PGRS family protein PE_PGRS16-like [Aethina tumida]|uniref:PE-PGRS family protein PE_PGRS16-like n=1 Tax=Aethina tumida TaxID=116153 RepID=UPI0021483435|nr:PE-PGRS family protein PE_PGRS16-like [Aethina tumida]
MNALIFTLLCALSYASAAPSWGHGAIVAGPAGIVTGHGAIGAWGGHGGTIIAGPSSAGAVVAGPGLGLGWGHGLWGHGLWGHGVRVQGPAVVPATISGPSGTIHSPGTWGHHGHIW